MNNNDYFICEICKQKTPKKYEGSEPNTCEDCMPKEIVQKIEPERTKFCEPIN